MYAETVRLLDFAGAPLLGVVFGAEGEIQEQPCCSIPPDTLLEQHVQAQAKRLYLAYHVVPSSGAQSVVKRLSKLLSRLRYGPATTQIRSLKQESLTMPRDTPLPGNARRPALL